MKQEMIDRANAAKRLQNNPDYIDIMKAIESDIFASFRSVKIGDSETLNDVHSMSHGLKLVTDRLSKYIQLANYEAELEEISDE